MTIRNRACLQREDTKALLYLPPFELRIDATELIEGDWITIPYPAATGAGYIDGGMQQRGWDIAVKGQYIFSDPGSGLLWQDSLRDFLRGTDGRPRAVNLCQWLDTAGTIKRYYRECKITGPLTFPEAGSMTDRSRSFEFRLRSVKASRAAAFPNGATPSAGPYEAYIYNGEPGTDDYVVFSVTRNMGQILVQFDNVIDAVTAAGNASYRQHKVRLSPDAAMKVTSIQAVGCGGLTGAAGDNTRVTSSNAAYSGAGDKLSVDVAGNTGWSAPVAGEVEVAADGYFYLYIEQAGGHVDLKIMVEFEEVTA